MEAKVTGQTKTVGFQIGVRRTLSLTPEEAWEAITSQEGIRSWLGEGAELLLEPKRPYVTESGAAGEIRVVKPLEQLRLTWRKPGWSKASTVQIRLIAAGPGRTTVSFHQEHLPDAAMREAMKEHWEEVLQRLSLSTSQ